MGRGNARLLYGLPYHVADLKLQACSALQPRAAQPLLGILALRSPHRPVPATRTDGTVELRIVQCAPSPCRPLSTRKHYLPAPQLVQDVLGTFYLEYQLQSLNEAA